MPFILREGFRGLRRNLTMTIALIITTALSLALLGTGLLVGKMTSDTKDIYLEQVQVLVQFDENISATDGECSSPECSELRTELEGTDGVESVEFRSREESYQRFVELFAESDPVLVEETTPEALPAALHVRLSDPTDISPLDGVGERPGVERVVDQTEDVRGATQHLDSIRNATLILALVQLVAAAFLIANMVTLSAHHRREETAIMRVVGASRMMTNGPFVLEAVVATAIGAVAGTVGMLIGNSVVVAPALRGLYDARLLARITAGDILLYMPFVGLGGLVLAGVVAAVTLRLYVRK
ncbi:cell division protein FtsX [Corynebacterium yudongzhengii]|uniref:Cell division protein FtsX n=1 Tax=Corynebacterium yudongzhengii TaxID=2080740 RepID=A0A2U1T4B1_9CORY|nr:permease-like cell division protein FtsX [Corynebacterium yudongzhengii]AWB82390.1 cell division protein FtsX [Corynebacterium yudongzhengii]PWC00823.1 ABC transporter permease [Corynebacterium yudongzhengii]